MTSISKTLTTSLFHPIDLLTARHLLPDADEPVFLFLAYFFKATREGHLCICAAEGRLLPSLSAQLDPLLLEGLERLPLHLFESQLVRCHERLYLRANWECEERLLGHLRRLQTAPLSLSLPSLQAYLERLTPPLHPEQQAALCKVAQQSVTCISGGPGTGKSALARSLLQIFLEKGDCQLLVTAPTAKAGANMQHALGPLGETVTVKTLHSLLKGSRSSGALTADLIVVDEAAMVDAYLLTDLFAKVKNGARLVLLGDKDQLPPIERGNIFADLSEIPYLVAELNHCWRTDLKEMLDLARAVKLGEKIPADPLPSPQALVTTLVREHLEKGVLPAPCLTPLRQGPYGVEALNHLFYQESQRHGVRDIPILITANHPAHNLYNGEVGFVRDQIAYFQAGRSLPSHLLPAHEKSYALSIHKSQGSEYDTVTVLIPPGAEHFGRELLYTAITRAKKQLRLLADSTTLSLLLQRQTRRLSGIKEKL